MLGHLSRLHAERRYLLRRLKGKGELAIGTVSRIRRKCGNPRCHCTEAASHLQTVFLFKDVKAGCRRCKLVRRADEARMLRAGTRYRKFRVAMKRLRAIDIEEKRILMALAEERAIRYE